MHQLSGLNPKQGDEMYMNKWDKALAKKFGIKLDADKPSPLIKRLCKKLKEQCGIECDPASFRRLRPGYWQRSMGAWSWSIRSLNSAFEFGSCDPVTVCVRKDHKLSWLNDPDDGSGITGCDEIVAELIKE